MYSAHNVRESSGVSPVSLEHLKAVDIEQSKNSAARLSHVTLRQRRVYVFDDPHEQTVVDALCQGVSSVDSLFTG